MHIVRNIKRNFNQIQVANAMYDLGYYRERLGNRPHNIDKMLEGLPRVELLGITRELGSQCN